MEYSKITVIVPTINEERNIGKLISRLESLYPGVHIIVSDDGSSDNTKNVVLHAIKRYHGIKFLDRSKCEVHGLTASVVDAIGYVKTAYVIVMDGDLQHPPELINAIYGKLLEGSDVVIGVRRRIKRWGLQRRIISKCINLFAIIVFKIRGKPIASDMMSGFFGVKSNLFKSIVKHSRKGFVMEGYKVLLDLLRMLPYRSKYRISEMPYDTFHERIYGKSKFKLKHMVNTLKSILL